MPKKKKKKSKKKTSKKIKKKKAAKKSFKKTKTQKVSKKKKKVRKKVSKNTDNKDQELIIKTKAEWVKDSLANKAQYTKKYNDSIRNNNEFWAKEEKELLGSNHTQKSKM